MSKVTITQISATIGPQGIMLFGLGSDNRVYIWDAKNGGTWLPNWIPAETAAGKAAAPRKAATKKGGKR